MPSETAPQGRSQSPGELSQRLFIRKSCFRQCFFGTGERHIHEIINERWWVHLGSKSEILPNAELLFADDCDDVLLESHIQRGVSMVNFPKHLAGGGVQSFDSDVRNLLETGVDDRHR